MIDLYFKKFGYAVTKLRWQICNKADDEKAILDLQSLPKSTGYITVKLPF